MERYPLTHLFPLTSLRTLFKLMVGDVRVLLGGMSWVGAGSRGAGARLIGREGGGGNHGNLDSLHPPLFVPKSKDACRKNGNRYLTTAMATAASSIPSATLVDLQYRLSSPSLFAADPLPSTHDPFTPLFVRYFPPTNRPKRRTDGHTDDTPDVEGSTESLRVSAPGGDKRSRHLASS